jgi:hypothetical protein
MPLPSQGSNFVSRDGTLGYWSTNAPDDFDFSGDDAGFWPVSRLRQQYIDYLTAKVSEYEEQKQSRHYRHGAQWTPEEIEILRKRRQPIITFNRINRKIDSIAGLVTRLRQDPKAWPRNPRNADGAEIATQSVRSVLDGADWAFLDGACAEQAGTEGIAGVEFKLIDGDHHDPDVAMDFVFGDDWFYDPRSVKPDFSDGRFHGLAKWLDVEAAIELFPDKEEELRTLMVETGFDLTTHADREYKWIYVNEKRLRLVEHWYRHQNKWYWAFYCSMLLLAQGVSPFLDERGDPMSRFEMWSAFVDHDGDRYGFVRNLKGPQDELNQRRSKALFMSNVTKLTAQKGAVDSIEVARRENARPDGYIEYNPGFEPPAPDPNKSADLANQLALMQDARQEIDSYVNINPATLAQSDQDEHSGVAINMLQKAGTAELGSFLRNYRSWKLRVYRKCWNIISRTWQNERYIRVSGEDKKPLFIQLNALELDEWGQPMIVNAIGSLNVEISMDEGPDESNLMQETYDVIKNDPTIPFAIKLMFLPVGSSFRKQIEQKMQEAAQSQPPDPKIQAAQLKAQTDQQKGQIDIHTAQMKAQSDQQKNAAEVQRANVQAEAEKFNAQQDALARQQDQQRAQAQHAADMRMEVMRVEAEREKLRLQMEQARQQHEYDMAELRAQHATRQAEHAAKRQAAAAQAKRRPAATQGTRA